VTALLAVALALAGCPHDSSLGTVSFVRGGALHAVSLADCRDRVLGKPARSRPPTQIRGVVVRGRALWLRRGGRLLRLTRPLPPDPALRPSPQPLALSPDGRWVLWVTAVQSNSIAADGVPLAVTRLAPGGRTRILARSMLAYRDYLTWCASSLVYTAGADRVATNGKRLLVAQPPDWKPRTLWNASGRAFGSVACAPDGRSVAVLSQPQSNDARFSATRWQLWRIGLNGTRTLLDSPPAGWADESPRWSPDGRALLFVRERRLRGRLMLLRGGRVIGPIVSLGYSLGFYGHHDWWAQAAWHV
jgi:hypothetical protein